MHTESIDLADLWLGVSTAPVEEGDRVDVVVSIRQRGDESARCGRPNVKDAFGNVLVTLSPYENQPGVGATYRYAFYAAAAGLYSVELDNKECDIRRTIAAAVVTWTVYRQ
ncbi:MAG: hypothetical protein HY666_03655 [Chloroflexi bacterium]|nr:hypothetical protein [Chloroflexota bacterium]